jgi:ABC-2 type transport system ATP-binding protein
MAGARRRPIRWLAVPAVVVDELTIRYSELVAVDAVSLTAEAGAVTAVLGPNGAGKTSTIEALEGYRRPAGGSVRVLGLDPIAQRTSLNRRIGVMLQEGGLHPAMRVRELVRLYAAYYDDPHPPGELLDRVGLAARTAAPVRRLSGGEQQRLSLALALVGRPSVALLDEPTSGVDVAGRQLIREVLGELRDDGVCVVLTSHDLAEAEKVADHVVVIDRGTVLANAPLGELVGGADDVRFSAPAGLDVAALGAHLGASVEEQRAGEYRIATAPRPQIIAALTAWLAERDVAVGDIRTERTLEEVFVRLTRADEG